MATHMYLLGLLLSLCLSSCAGASACDSGCGRNLLSVVDPDSEEIRAVRLEAIKKQILSKLRLREPPNVRLSRATLPSIVTEQALDADEGVVSSDREPYFARMDTAILLAEDDSSCPPPAHGKQSQCFRFKLTRDVQAKPVQSSELSVHVSSDVDHTFLVYEVIRGGNGKDSKVIFATQGRRRGGWLKFNVTQLLQRWRKEFSLVNQRPSFRTFQVVCDTCTPTESTLIGDVFEQSGDHRPILIVKPAAEQRKARMRRSTTCEPKQPNQKCCKESFRVNFADIGWGEWIVHPLGYEANYCRGSCHQEVTNTNFHHGVVISSYLAKKKHNETIGLSQCCVASVLSPLNIMYLSENNTIFENNIPNMVVESCGCA